MTENDPSPTPAPTPPPFCPCRICEVARATGEDDLCDGCRTAIILKRAG